MRLSYQKLKTEADPEYHSVTDWMISQDPSSFRIRFSNWWCLQNFLQKIAAQMLFVTESGADGWLCPQWLCSILQAAFTCQINSAILEGVMKCFKQWNFPLFTLQIHLSFICTYHGSFSSKWAINSCYIQCITLALCATSSKWGADRRK